jgi:hypothetical protein
MMEPSDSPPPTITQSGKPEAASPADGDATLSPSAATPTSDITESPFRLSDDPDEVVRLGRYRLVETVGVGGMGVVFLALDEHLRRRAAIKVMLPKYAAAPAARERFLREARTCAGVRSEHVVTIYDVGEERGVPFIAMEYLQGYSLEEHLKRRGASLSVPQVLRVGREIAEGLAAAHALGLVHRDIKPANVWLEAPQGRVKILDFGLAKPVSPDETEDDGSLTRTGQVVGTPAYMSPEQARGERVDPRTDLFSLGGVLYRVTTGRLPFEGPTAMAILTSLGGLDTPTPVQALNPAVPDPLADLIHRLLAKDAVHRPASAAEVAGELRRIELGLASGELSAGHPVPMATAIGAEPQVIYVPVQVVGSEPSAFAGLDDPSSVVSGVEPVLKPKQERQRPDSKLGLFAAGAAVLLVVALGAVAWRKLNPPKVSPPPDEQPLAAVVPAKPVVNHEQTPALPAGWQWLFDGKDLSAWQTRDGKPAPWKVRDGYAEVTPGAGDILTRERFRDYQLYLEYWLAPTNTPDINRRSDSGVFLHGLYEVQILDDYGLPPGLHSTGGLVHQIGPVWSQSKPAGQWQTLDITFVAPRRNAGGELAVPGRVRVIHNNEVVLDAFKVSKASIDALEERADRGPIMLAKTNNGAVRYRNVRIRPFDLADTPGFFNGRNLAGWTGDPARWRAGKDEINGLWGQSEEPRAAPVVLASDAGYGDFELSFKAHVGAPAGKETTGYGYAAVYLRASPAPGDPARWGGLRCNLGPGRWGQVTRMNAAGNDDPPERPELDRLIDGSGLTTVWIRCVGKRVTVRVNGSVTTDSEFPDAPAAGRIAWHLGPRIDGLAVRDIHFADLSNPGGRERAAAERLVRVANLDLALEPSGEVRHVPRNGVVPPGPFSVKAVSAPQPDDPDAFLAALGELRSLRTLADFNSAVAWNGGALARLAAFPCAGTLTTLQVPGYTLRADNLDALKKIPGLTSLHLSAASADDDALTGLAAAFPKMTILSLHQLDRSQKVSERGLKAVAVLPLARLHLGVPAGWGVKLAEVVPAMPELTHLGCRFVTAEDAVSLLPVLARCPKLDSLYLEGALTDSHLEHLKGASRLRTLTLKNAQVTEAGLARFRRLRPECRVNAQDPPAEPRSPDPE